MRYAHIVSKNKNTEEVQQAIWFDTETDSVIEKKDTTAHKLRFGYACYMRRVDNGQWSAEDWLHFTGIPEFWAWVMERTRPKTKLYMFCHNASFDLPVVDTFHFLPENDWKLMVGIIDGPPVIVGFTRRKATILILDTLNFWRMPLAELGKSIGLPKLEMPAQDAPVEAWDKYAKRDVEIIMEACVKWWEFLSENDLGGFAYSLAAQSMRTFRHKYMHHEIFIDVDEQALSLARRAYHGGRNECFFIGTKKEVSYMLDINSMYPYVMAYEPMPVKLVSHTTHANAYDLAEWIQTRCVVTSALIETDKPAISVVMDGKLVFPIGRFEAVLSTPEIEWLLSNGRFVRVYEAAVYERAIIFDDFVENIYRYRLDARKRGDDVQSEFFKKLLQSLYGKWGQNGRKWHNLRVATDLDIATWIEIDYDERRVVSFRKFGGLIQRLSVEGESSSSHPAIAAHITAGARMYLWKLITKAGVENVLYCDTDSIMVSRAGFEALESHIDEKRLGALKLEGVFPHVKIFGAKDYIFGVQTKIKGIRRNAALISPNTYEQEKWSTLRGLLREGIIDRPLVTRIRKHLRRVYDKGIVQSNGRVTPLVYF